MKVYTRHEFAGEKSVILKHIKEGAIFIYPTDTIYGIGCNALDENAVRKVRMIKKRPNMPFSVIAPSKKWITDNVLPNASLDEWIDKLPGPYTFVLKTKNDKIVAPSVNPELNSLGIRIPNHWFSNIVSDLGFPIVTTSVNKAGEQYMTSLEDLDQEIKIIVDYIFYEGEKLGKPSTVVLFDKDKAEIKER